MKLDQPRFTWINLKTRKTNGPNGRNRPGRAPEHAEALLFDQALERLAMAHFKKDDEIPQ